MKSLIVFTKYPRPGKVKTRLSLEVGKSNAARIHRIFTERTCRLAVRFTRRAPVDVTVSFEGGTRALMSDWLGSGFSYARQTGGDLGERMDNAFADRFTKGYTAVVLIGVDCPDLSLSILDASFRALTCSDVVLGPAADGGYYLIGLRRRTPALFQAIRWGTHSVLSQTTRRINELGLRCSRLDVLHDVDRPNDILRYPDLVTQYGGEIEDGSIFQTP